MKIFHLIQIGYGVGYRKALNLQPNACFQQGVIQHELIHVLGNVQLIELKSIYWFFSRFFSRTITA